MGMSGSIVLAAMTVSNMLQRDSEAPLMGAR
jgi:hypothetical protein